MINCLPDMYNLRGQTVSKFGLDSTGQINYSFNSQGFRSNLDYNQVPWAALFGCSLIFGIGVEHKDIVTSLLPNTYNFGLAGNYSNNDIYKTIVAYARSDLYSPSTRLCVVWTDRDSELLDTYVRDLDSVPMYHFFCGKVVPGRQHRKFVRALDQDVSGTHMGPETHKFFAKVLWTLFDQ